MTARRSAGAPAPAKLAWPDRLVEAGALFLLVFTPLAYGTVEPWSEAIAELVVLGMALVWISRMLRAGELRIELPPGWLPAVLFLALVAFQVTPLPGTLLRLVPTWTVGLHDTAAAYAYAGAPVGRGPLSLDPHETSREGLKLAAVAAFFLVGYNSFRTGAQVRRLLWTMMAMGTLISVFGIVQRATWNGRLYWIGPEAPGGALYTFGPYVNRAHFAGLMAIVVPVALALGLAGRAEPGRPPLDRGWAARFRGWVSHESGPGRLVPFLVLVFGGAALVAGSRGGVVALGAALLAMIGLGARGRSGRGRTARLALAAVLILLAGVWIGGDVLYATMERFAAEAAQPEASGRIRLWQDAGRLWRHAPIVGTGLGTFEVAFPSVRRVRAPVVFTHAESDWMQLLTDTGAAGLGLALASAAGLGLALWRRRQRAETRGARAVALAGLVALVATMIQGIGNYNLPVMSNLIYLAAAISLSGASEGISGG